MVGKNAFRTAGITAGVIILLLGGVTMYLMRGMNEVASLEIGDVNPSGLADGVYVGRYDGYRWSNAVEVTVRGGRITGIDAVDRQLFHRDEVEDEIFGRVIAGQTTDVDTVTGATVSSKALLKAVENALRK